MADSTRPSIFFLGATGGCTLSALVHALNDGYHCIALVRTPIKLMRLLKDIGVTPSVIDSSLTIEAGDATDVSVLKGALLRNLDDHGRLPDVVISGLGGSPRTQFALPPFTIDQPTICEDSANALVTALSELYASNPLLQSSKPLLCYVSTGGMYPGQDDIPWLLHMMYTYILSVPWKDKKAMEKVFHGDQGREVFRTAIAVKVSLLTDGPELGEESVKVGTSKKPVSGYSISRKDVGGWIYRNILVGGAEAWEEEFVSITY